MDKPRITGWANILHPQNLESGEWINFNIYHSGEISQVFKPYELVNCQCIIKLCFNEITEINRYIYVAPRTPLFHMYPVHVSSVTWSLIKYDSKSILLILSSVMISVHHNFNLTKLAPSPFFPVSENDPSRSLSKSVGNILDYFLLLVITPYVQSIPKCMDYIS